MVGHHFQPGPWLLVEQARIDAFAQCTGDQQFIHVDPDRAKRETPFGGTIAHGFLTLSLLAAHPAPDFPVFEDLGLCLNYGLDRVRFLSPVPAGSRVRLLASVLEVSDKGPGRTLLRQSLRMEIENAATPAWIAEGLTLWIAA